jgi:CheY-like chemotaxis protein
MALVDACMRDHAAGRTATWAHGVGRTLQEASRALGLLWSEEAPLPDDVRWHAAALFGCTSRDVPTYGALAQRMLRQLPRYLPPDTPGAGPPSSRRGASAAPRGVDEGAVREAIAEAARRIAHDRRIPWAGFFGASPAEAHAHVGALWSSEELVPDDVRRSMAHVLECPAGAIATYGQLARRLTQALPRAFELQQSLGRPRRAARDARGESPHEAGERAAFSVSRDDGATTPSSDAMTTPRPPAPSRSKSGVRSKSSIGRLRVLVVEADADFAVLLGELLADDGHRPAIVFTAEQARALLDTGSFDLVLVESSGGGAIDGVGLARELRAAGRAEVVVVMVDYRSAEIEAEALAAGAGACIAKPFGREELFAAIQKAVLRAARSGST